MHSFDMQDKILQSTGRGRAVTVTNDGATILKSLHIDNPAAKVLVGILCFTLNWMYTYYYMSHSDHYSSLPFP